MSDVVYRQVGGHQVTRDVYAPVGPRPAEGWPAVLALPGGGWRRASMQDYGGAASALSRSGFVVVAVDYTYSDPGVRTWPTNLEDVREAVRWVRRNATRIGVDPGKIAVMGESAGGHLAALAGTYPDGRVITEGTPEDPVGQPTGGVSARVQAVVNFYGPGDLLTQYRDSPRDRPYMASFLGGTPDRVPGRYVAASAVSHVSPDDPPMLIFQGTRDAIVPMSQSVELDAALRAAGVPSRLVLLDGFSHGFRFDLGRGVSVLPEVVGFLNTALQVEPNSNRRV
jgi:acetyl esterase/lipase